MSIQANEADRLWFKSPVGIEHWSLPRDRSPCDDGAVAEGVETPGALALLADAGCDEAQGYLFAKPRPAAEFASWLQRLSGEERAAA